jgi:serine phosphatase RsbU (regulator of sigma subunit)/predicted ATPase/class 3 adenylate cyclase
MGEGSDRGVAFSGEADTRADRLGERRTVTALFVDIVGSTELAGRLRPETWAAILEGALERCTPIIARYEGTIAQARGDELLAFFGVPAAHEDDAVRAVRAALDLLDATREYAQEIQQEHGVEWAVRISLSTGPVIVDFVGQEVRYEQARIGDAANLAAQVESIKWPMAVLIAEDTCRLVAPFFECEELGALQAQGQSGRVHVYQVRGAKEEPEWKRRDVEPQSPMVGRDAELATLLELSGAVRAGLGRTALVIGEPGLGKTRLVAEWQAADGGAHSGQPLRWAKGRCLSYSREMAYHLLLDLLHALIDVPSGAGEPEIDAALLSLVQDLFGSSERGEGQAVYAFLGHLLSIRLEGAALELVRHLDPQALRPRYLSALQQLLAALAGRGPLVVILENLHWADPSSVDLLVGLLPLASTAAVLFCIVARPDYDAPGWRLITAARDLMGQSLAELVLQPLSESESCQLAANLLGLDVLPEQVKALVLKRAEGNPFFIEEVIRTLIDGGIIVRQDGGWMVSQGIDSIEIPDSLQGLLLGRIDRLADDVKHVLRVASVIGRQFSARVLGQVLGEGERGAALVRHLSALESAGLVRVVQVVPELVYRFRSGLVQDVAYHSMLLADRQRLHLAVGEALERIYPEEHERQELAPTLAQHFTQGAAADTSRSAAEQRALDYLVLAGSTALAAFANQEAESYYQGALAFTRDRADLEPRRAGLLLDLGEALYRQSRFHDAIRSWKEGIALYRATGDRDSVARLYARSARAAWYNGDQAESLRLCREGLETTAGAPESPGIAILTHEAARAYHFSGQSPELARSLCLQALEIAERLGAVEVQAEALATLGILPDQPPEAAVEALSRAVELAESAGLLFQARRAHNNLAAVLQEFLADFRSAQEHYRRAAELSRQTGSIEGELIVLSNMIGAFLLTGDLGKVEETLPVLRRLLGEAANPGPAALGMRISEGLLARYRGDLAKAARLLSACQAEARGQGDLEHLALSLNALTQTLLESCVLSGDTKAVVVCPAQRIEEIEAIVGEAIEISGRGSPGGRIWPRCLQSVVLACQGKFEDAHQVLAEVREWWNARQVPLEEAQISWAEAHVAALGQRWDEALALFEAAAALLAKLGMRWWWGRMLLDWAGIHLSRGEPTDLERARALLREALVTFEELGVPRYAELARERMRVLTARTYAYAVAHQRATQELAVARQVQKSFLPDEPPHIPGWQVAMALEPARQTSGDFYDFIPLPNGRWGIVIADVADKGMGAALYMAVSRTLIRTYAAEYHSRPDFALRVTNRRILADSQVSTFVTAFYLILDPLTGTLEYCNAGHNPPYLLRAQENAGAPFEAHVLHRTGMALGVAEDASWEQATIQMDPGDILVLYTDGVTEAQDAGGTLFGDERLLAVLGGSAAMPARPEHVAQGIRDALLARVREFVGDASQFDDITLVVIARDAAGGGAASQAGPRAEPTAGPEDRMPE